MRRHQSVSSSYSNSSYNSSVKKYARWAAYIGITAAVALTGCSVDNTKDVRPSALEEITAVADFDYQQDDFKTEFKYTTSF